jgi:hypothetical protein
MRFPLNETDYLGTVRFTPEEESGGEQIELYMPTSLQFGDKVEYENVGIGALGAATSDTVGRTGDTTKLQSYADAMGGDNATDVMKLGVSQLVSTFSDKAGAVARDATRVAPNPNTRAIFKQVSLRQFQMTFKLIPNSEQEAREIGSIIREFRTNMYPEEIEGNFGYRFPTRYKIEAMYNGFVLQNILTEPCYLESVMTNYNPSSHAFMKSGSGSQGFFSEIDLSLTFIEGKTLNRKSIQAGF